LQGRKAVKAFDMGTRNYDLLLTKKRVWLSKSTCTIVNNKPLAICNEHFFNKLHFQTFGKINNDDNTINFEIMAITF